MTTMDQIHRIRELFYEQGKNLNEIAIIMNCDWRTVRKYVDMEDFSSPPPAPLRNEALHGRHAALRDGKSGPLHGKPRQQPGKNDR